MNILIVAFETGRWGPVRLVASLVEAGCTISALCPEPHELRMSGHVTQKFHLKKFRRINSFAQILIAAAEQTNCTFIVPGDEQAVAALQALRRSRIVNEKLLKLLDKSLGSSAASDALLYKHKSFALADSLGIICPQSINVTTLAQARAAAEELGYPLFVKSPFSWAGIGTLKVSEAKELQSAFARLLPKGPKQKFKSFLRQALGWDWYPTPHLLQIQKPIEGRPLMYCAVAFDGKLLAGFAAKAVQTKGESGPSTIVDLYHCPKLAATAAKLIEATCASGFLGFDFMTDAQTGVSSFLECNPRPIQICHLGHHIGVNLSAALVAEESGKKSVQIGDGETSKTIALYPQARLAGTSVDAEILEDVPENDQALAAYCRTIL